jgi:signal transduction histidine kinase
MSETKLYPFLRNAYFFKDLSDEEIRLVAGLCDEEEREAGDVIFVEGSMADRFYIVIEGRVEVWKNFYDPKPDLLAIHGTGHFFGEMALIDELPRSATVVAKERLRLLSLYRDDFRRLITEKASIALSVMKSISYLVRSANEAYVEDLRTRNAELEKAYTELEREQAKRLRNERLSTMGKFSTLILHDIRNPLSSLKGQLQLMEMRIDDPSRLAGHIRASLTEIGRLERLAGEFLDYSRGEVRLDMAVTSAGRILDRLRENLSDRLARSDIRLEMENRYDEPVILDAERVLRALHNLADNARKAMSPKGGLLRIVASRNGEHLDFEVTDQGEGMSPEVLERLFEPFFSAFGKGGTGLGMLIVKNIAEAHGGNVRIDSMQGQGTTVTLSFPLRA